ncbi:hypothetical protein BKA62DRAFT_719682 [Auriculariales sp. MPI-PUGE-AT-0066]|nr:hypothetical protein BKA62DRAFT_719682 [Auriculariales sp. MPI-PUGE-AT-0066]
MPFRAASFALALSLVASYAHATPSSLTSLARRADRLKTDAGYVSPLDHGGKMLTFISITYPEGLGEPINAIISGNSDAAVLVDSAQNGGLRNYFLSVYMAGECLGQHLGGHQGANLGDGNGEKNETAVIRFDYYDPYLGTCQESIKGGNHLRYWTQDGPQANTGAVFMACSVEKSADQYHDIIPDGYNLGRDWIVGNATAQASIPTPDLTAGATYVGSTSFGNYTYETTATYVSGLLSNSSDGVNHLQTVPVNGRAAIDGLVAVLTVKITGYPPGVKGPNGDARISKTWSPVVAAAALVLAAVLALW